MRRMIPVWFFVGVLLAVYGALILASGIAGWSNPPQTVLADLHASAWWGALLLIVGIVYVIRFRPHC